LGLAGSVPVSLLLVGVGLFIRLRIAETPAFSQVQETGAVARLPLFDALRSHPKNILLAMGARLAENGVFYIYSVFVLVYVTEQLKLPRSVALNGVLLATVGELVSIPAFGALSDRIGRRPVYMAEPLSPHCLPFLSSGSLIRNTRPSYGSPSFSDSPSATARCTDRKPVFSLNCSAHECATAAHRWDTNWRRFFAGGFSPLIATSLLRWSHGKPWPIAIYMMVMALITLVSVYLTTETRQDDLIERSP
jgi:MFS family permease